MHAYLLALEIEPVEVNKVYVALPLHCTVVHWFRSDKSPAEIIQAVRPIIEITSPLEIVGGKPDMFGEEKDVPVNRLQDDAQVLQLHKTLHDTLRKLDVIDVVPKWTQDGFNTHVTRQRSGRFEIGRKHLATKLYLLEAMVPEQLQQKKVINRFYLRGTA